MSNPTFVTPAFVLVKFGRLIILIVALFLNWLILVFVAAYIYFYSWIKIKAINIHNKIFNYLSNINNQSITVGQILNFGFLRTLKHCLFWLNNVALKSLDIRLSIIQQTTNPLISRSLPGSLDYACYELCLFTWQGIPLIFTINAMG